VVPVNGHEALRLARALAREEGIFVGTSSGGALAAALTVARRAAHGSNIVCMLADTGERYLSTPLFEDIAEEMNEEELALSRSTPNFRFDAPPAAAMAPAAPATARARSRTTDVDAERFVTEAIEAAPVVMFALEWCEFCWSVRRLFAKLGIAYESVDLDSVVFQKDDLGGRIRAVLEARTGAKTIPRIFVGGEHVGGATDLFDAWRAGALQRSLEELGVSFRDASGVDPYSFLPKWLHPRKTA
jgi:cysteine synthase A